MTKNIMTYRELYSLFRERNKDLEGYVTDYSPAPGGNQIQIWLNNRMTFYVRYVSGDEGLAFSEVQ